MQLRLVPVLVRKQECAEIPDLVDECDELVLYPIWAALQHHPLEALLYGD